MEIDIIDILATKYQTHSIASLYLISYTCTNEELKNWQTSLLKKCQIHLNHPDVLHVNIDQDDQRYFVESKSIEEMFSFISFKPVNLKKKIVFINQAELLGTIVSNKFLKVFEELPSYVTLFLFTHNLGSIIPTVASRAIKIKINQYDANNDIAKALPETPQQAINSSAHAFDNEKEVFERIILEKTKNNPDLNFSECQKLIYLLKTNHQASIYNSPKLSRITRFFP